MSNDKPSIHFGDHANIETFQTGENAKVVHGDEVAGDKIGNQVHGDNHGSMQQTNLSADYHSRCRLAVGQCVRELQPVFADAPSSSQGGDGGSKLNTKTSPSVGDAAPDTDTNSPQVLFKEAVTWSESPKEPTPAQVSSFGERWTQMLSRGGRAAAEAIENVGPIAVSVIKAIPSPPFPWNLIAAGIDATVKRLNEIDNINDPQ